MVAIGGLVLLAIAGALLAPRLDSDSGQALATATPKPTPTPASPTASPTTEPTAFPVEEPTAVPTDPLTEEPTAEPEPPSNEPKQFAPGEPIIVTEGGEEWARIVVDRVKQVRRYDGPYNIDDVPRKGNIYVELRVTYTALQDGVDYNQFDWQVFVGGEAADEYSFVSNGPEPTLSSGTLPKGRKASGWLVFEVAARGKVLLSYEGNMFLDEAPVFEVVLRSK